MSEQQITCDHCGVPLFVTTTRLVDALGGVVCAGGGNYHDHDGVMGMTGAMGALYAEATRAPSNRLIMLAPERPEPTNGEPFCARCGHDKYDHAIAIGECWANERHDGCKSFVAPESPQTGERGF